MITVNPGLLSPPLKAGIELQPTGADRKCEKSIALVECFYCGDILLAFSSCNPKQVKDKGLTAVPQVVETFSLNILTLLWTYKISLL